MQQLTMKNTLGSVMSRWAHLRKEGGLASSHVMQRESDLPTSTD